MKKEETDARKRFADRVAKQTVTAPIQRVEPDVNVTADDSVTKERTKPDETQLNVHLDTELLRQLKMKGAAQGKNIKTMIREAVDDYLKK